MSCDEATSVQFDVRFWQGDNPQTRASELAAIQSWRRIKNSPGASEIYTALKEVIHSSAPNSRYRNERYQTVD